MSHNFDDGSKRLRDIINSKSKNTLDLPCVHSTDSYVLRTIVEEDSIKPQACDVFKGDMLTYFFYGRPAYRPNQNAKPTTQAAYLPVCLILKPDANIHIRRIFPFDTGAFHLAYLEDFFHPKMGIGDFSLEPNPDTPGKFISYMFGSNDRYFAHTVDPNLAIEAGDFEIESCRDLLSTRGSNMFDSRSATIEIQTSATLSFSEVVEAVILPSAFQDSIIAEQLNKFGIEMHFYNAYSQLAPSEYTYAIIDHCRRHLAMRNIHGKL